MYNAPTQESLAMRSAAYRRNLAIARGFHAIPEYSRLRTSSADGAAAHVLPVRAYIENALYAPRSGYFSRRADLPILSHPNRVHFSDLKHRAAYESYLAATFAREAHGWMTPVELFSPYLANAVANRIAASHNNYNSGDDLVIVEFGGGRGTLARDILAKLQSSHRDVFEKTKYHLADISESLSAQQAASVSEFSKDGTAFAHCKAAADWLVNDAAKYVDGSQRLHVLAFELLDNLPHDLFRYAKPSTSTSAADLDSSHLYEQAYVDSRTRECIWSSTIDPRARAALAQYIHHDPQDDGSAFSGLQYSVRNLMDSLMQQGGDSYTYIWVPTTAHEILSAIPTNAALTIADFTEFPGALPHVNGPVIQRVKNGVATVYESVLEAPHGEVDIMFPTDFARLEKKYGQSARAVSQADFFRQYAQDEDIKNSTCESGYNPILEDFINTKILLVDP